VFQATSLFVTVEYRQNQHESSDSYDVFLSYHSRDQALVEAIAHWLRVHGLKVFLDAGISFPGNPGPGAGADSEQLRLLSPCASVPGDGALQQREKDVALDRQAHEPTFPVIPILLPAPTGAGLFAAKHLGRPA